MTFFIFHPFNCRKVGPVQLSCSLFLLLPLILNSRARFQYAFKKHIKSANIKETKNKTEIFLIFLNVKMSAKPIEIELYEEFIAMWRDVQSL